MMTSYGWIECVGLADRSAFDLTKHAKGSKTVLQASRKFKQPKKVEVIQGKLDRKEIGKTFKQQNKFICEALEALDDEDRAAAFKLQEEGKEFPLSFTNAAK